nr:MAG TPA: virion morphogenesis protein [Caudoviricetes sp.]
MTRLPKMPKSLLKLPLGFKKPKVKDFISDMQRLGEEIAEEFKETIVENIETNRYGYELKQSTIDRKGSEVPLVDSHQLVEAIYRDGTTVSVEDSARDDSPLSNLELAIVQEYGTKDKHIPARPVWRETFKDFKDVARERISSFLDDPKFKK